jgi:hypothetical protein
MVSQVGTMWHYAALLYPICTNNLLFYNFKCKLEVKAPSKKKKRKKRKEKREKEESSILNLLTLRLELCSVSNADLY